MLLKVVNATNASPNEALIGNPVMSDSENAMKTEHPADNNDIAILERRKSFGEWLRNCRRQARITQAELAQALGYDSSQLISNIERGVSLLPSRRMPDLLLKYLPVIEVLEYGKGTEDEIISAIRKSR